VKESVMKERREDLMQEDRIEWTMEDEIELETWSLADFTEVLPRDGAVDDQPGVLAA
jgi:hypothetical protein